MSVPDLVPIYDLEVFFGVSLELGFEFQVLNPDGTEQDPPVYWDFTGKELLWTFTDIFRTPLALSSTAPSTNGSVLLIDTDPTTGLADLSLTQEEMGLIVKQVGYHHLRVIETGQEDKVLFRGTIVVTPFTADGEL